MTSARALHIVQTTGWSDYLRPSNGDRRFAVIKAPQLHEFRISVPGHDPFHGLFPNANAARLQAEQIYPDAHPASVVCTSRTRLEAHQ
ncbi:hypothetical protein ACIGHN_13495 [Acidovorax sp. NPDC077693]|uniref:hypothetical protein n=1 Tax=unclassified Acidovorax TaxID=2684926 RepID=UPI0037C61A0E